MSLANGRPYLAIPGPSVIPDRVLQAMHRPSPNIYEGDLVDLVAQIIPDLKAVARTQHQVAIYMGNGHAAWEAALCNILSRGDKVLVPVTGLFGTGWAAIATGLGADVETIEHGLQSAMDMDRIKAALRADTDHSIKAVLAVHVDTSTSVKNDISALRAVLDAVGHPALLVVDCIASLGCDRFEMDEWGVDVMIAASQKGLMTPAGLCFVFFNSRAEVARENANCVTSYWNWNARARPELFYQYFFGTAPSHHLFALHEALKMIVQEEGMEAVWARHEMLAQAVWAAFETWGGAQGFMNIQTANTRSHAVTTIDIRCDKADALRQWCETNCGLTLGIPLGMAPMGGPPSQQHFRLGHMGHVNAPMILGALGVIEAGMIALDIPHTAGGVLAATKIIAAA